MPKKIINEYSQAVFNLPWLVAEEEGFFSEEGLEVEFIRAKERDASLPPEADPTQVDPFWRHAPFEDLAAQSFNACEWGQIRRSHDSTAGGRIITLRPAVISQAIFVRPDSPVTHLPMLRDKTIAVNFHAGSHFLTLQLLEGFMERNEIKVVHMGQARLRYQAMLDGQVDAAMLMEPFLALAEKTECNLILLRAAQGLTQLETRFNWYRNRSLARTRLIVGFILSTQPSPPVQKTCYWLGR